MRLAGKVTCRLSKTKAGNKVGSPDGPRTAEVNPANRGQKKGPHARTGG